MCRAPFLFSTTLCLAHVTDLKASPPQFFKATPIRKLLLWVALIGLLLHLGQVLLVTRANLRLGCVTLAVCYLIRSESGKDPSAGWQPRL